MRHKKEIIRIMENVSFHTLPASDFYIKMSSDQLPIKSDLSRMDVGVYAICLKGHANIEVDLKKYEITKNTFVVFFPGQLIHQKDVSNDFEVMYFTVSSSMLSEMLLRFPSEFTAFLKLHSTYLDRAENRLFEKNHFEVLKSIYDDKDNICRRDIIINMVRIYYLALYNYIHSLLNKDSKSRTRQMEIFEKFVKLVTSHYKESREVMFYADKIFITPKYLSCIVKEQDGRSAKEWIDDYVIAELKMRLRLTDETVHSIACDMNFADLSFLCKYISEQKIYISPPRL